MMLSDTTHLNRLVIDAKILEPVCSCQTAVIVYNGCESAKVPVAYERPVKTLPFLDVREVAVLRWCGMVVTYLNLDI